MQAERGTGEGSSECFYHLNYCAAVLLIPCRCRHAQQLLTPTATQHSLRCVAAAAAVLAGCHGDEDAVLETPVMTVDAACAAASRHRLLLH